MNTETLEPKIYATGPISLNRKATGTPVCTPLKNILVPLNFSATSLNALQYAVLLARQFKARITLVHFLQPALFFSDYPYPGPLGQDVFDTIRNQLCDIRSKYIPPDLQVDSVVRQCFVFDGIPEVAQEVHADLIIASSESGMHLKQLFMRSTAETILRRAPCPVLVVRERDYHFL